MTYLDFEKPIADLQEQLDALKTNTNGNGEDHSRQIKAIEDQIRAKRKEIYSNLTVWQKIQISRHPERPYTLFYAEKMCSKFIELHGDRYFADDKAIVGGFAEMDGQAIMIVGHQKGINTKMRQYRNFGMANPEGYRKALRLMKLAEKFNKPIVTLIDTPGAYPGLEAEERGQAEAIARNIYEMMKLQVPVVCVIVGEGASGGALGIGIGDRVAMLENTWYSVISPESCSSILWRSWDYKEVAADALKPTAPDMQKEGLIDDIIREPIGGAHQDPDAMARTLKKYLQQQLSALRKIPADERITNRINKFSSMGAFAEMPKKRKVKTSALKS